MSKPQLYYFDAAGRGDMIRLPFYIGGIPFEDIRFSHDAWPGEYKEKSPSGQVPLLILPDGTKIVESMACCMYASTMAGLVPIDPIQAAFAEQAVGLFMSSLQLVRPLFDPSNNCDRPAIIESLKSALKNCDRIVGQTMSPEGFTIGTELSFADIVIYTSLFKAMGKYLPEITLSLIEQQTPHLFKICQTTSKHPKVAAFYA